MSADWDAGARAEAELRNRRIGKARPIVDYLIATNEAGFSYRRMVESCVRVFTADWSLRDRLRIAWKIVRRP